MNTTRIIIVEDEPGAAKDLMYVLHKIRPQYHAVAVLPSVKGTLEWLENNASPQLGFFDIHLQDGDSFSIFESVSPPFPVIFTTAYDQHAIEAFKVNSIDYLLKPILQTDLERSLQKYEALYGAEGTRPAVANGDGLAKTELLPSTLLISFREKLVPIPIIEFGCFYIEHNIVYGLTFSNQVHIVNHTMEDLEKMLHPGRFFRANRQCIVNRRSITELEHFFNGRLIVRMSPSPRELVIVSKAKATEFKKWIERSIII